MYSELLHVQPFAILTIKFFITQTICWNQEEDVLESAKEKRTPEKTTRQIQKSTILIRKMKF